MTLKSILVQMKLQKEEDFVHSFHVAKIIISCARDSARVTVKEGAREGAWEGAREGGRERQTLNIL